jgi:hypothetical protein
MHHRYKHTPVQLPLELDGAAKDSGYAAEVMQSVQLGEQHAVVLFMIPVSQAAVFTMQGSRDVPWKISSKDQNGIMLLLEAIPGWKRIMQGEQRLPRRCVWSGCCLVQLLRSSALCYAGVMGRNLEFHKHVPWSLLEEDGKVS